MKSPVNYPCQLFSSIILLVAFLWLIMGASFLTVERHKQAINKATSKSDADETGKASTPFENTTNDKTEHGTNAFSGEYLNEETESIFHTDIPLKHNKRQFEKAFPAIYSESVSQPPEIVSC